MYEGLSCLVARDFAGACALLLDSVSTFTAYEVTSYEQFVFLTVLAALKTLDRVTLKARVVDSSDVLAAIGGLPDVGALLAAFYECRYRDFFGALVRVVPAAARNRYLAPHAPYFLREMRVAAYAQFLQSYKSVTVAGMARAFGVTPPFLDAELARFIAGGRLAAKIDAVAGIIETARVDAKNAQYLQVLKLGDAVLNKVQKLSRAAAM